MHERALTRDLLRKIEEVARAGGATRVTRVSVRLGALAHLTPEHFEAQFFENWGYWSDHQIDLVEQFEDWWLNPVGTPLPGG